MLARWPFRLGPALGVALFVLGCDVPPTAPPLTNASEEPRERVLRGQAAFVSSCAPCHASGDGLDLAFFNFTDTTIVRRAVVHVDTATALDIVAFVHTLDIQRASRDLRLFQPSGAVLSGDVALASALFGRDEWPADLTSARLAEIDPLQIPTAVALPQWSVEQANLDWMPSARLPSAILDDRNGLVRSALSTYRAAPTTENLVRVVSALRTADRRLDNPGAPCVFDVPERVDYVACFEARRWASSLAAQHMIRNGIAGRLHRVAHETWWDVGNAARKAIAAHVPFERGEANWASWMYLGWIFEPARFASVYTGNGLIRIGLPRHATFVALRSQVARPARSMAVYADVQSAARFAPPHWAFNAVRFGYAHLLERIRVGDVPTAPDLRAEARTRVEGAYAVASRKIPADQGRVLRQAADEVLVLLQ
jgi:hypothetical protein